MINSDIQECLTHNNFDDWMSEENAAGCFYSLRCSAHEFNVSLSYTWNIHVFNRRYRQDGLFDYDSTFHIFKKYADAESYLRSINLL